MGKDNIIKYPSCPKPQKLMFTCILFETILWIAFTLHAIKNYVQKIIYIFRADSHIFVVVLQILTDSLFLSVGIVGSIMFLMLISDLSACYQFHKNGLYVKYPFVNWQCIPWNSFQQICICYPYDLKTGFKADTIICFVKQGEKKNPFGRWKTENPFHHRRVISFPLDQEIIDALQRKCNIRIDDLRGCGAYPHPKNVRHDIRLKTSEELQKTEQDQ